MNRWLDGMIRRVIRRGRLKVIWSDGSVSWYGDGGGHEACLRFLHRSAEAALVRNPDLALGEAYMDGRIDFPDDCVLPFLMLVNENWEAFRRLPFVGALSWFRYATRRVTQNNSLLKARRHIARHYDLDERIYRLFLDSDMQYSCGYFERPGIGLDEAQWAKKRHLAAKLALQPGQEVLDIGSGWGGLGMFLSETADVKVTGVTLSEEQHRVSSARARERGLHDRFHVRLQDYRRLQQQYDRIVSVGMFEHVGAARYREFFSTVRGLLKPDGVMLLHSIGRFGPPGSTNPWIAKYIFPGGYIPALSEVIREVERVGLYVTDIEILRLHYAETLRAWRTRFRARWDEAAAIYDERFCRMWEFYLAGSEAALRAGGMMVFQIQFARNQSSLPITRDYIYAAEAAMNAAGDGGESLRLAGE